MKTWETIVRFFKNGKNADIRYDILRRKMDELLYAERFHDVVKDTGWFCNSMPGLMPGGGAVGYNFLLALFVILNNARPQHILELGMGQSTKVLEHYIKACGEIGSYHLAGEHDEDFADYCKKKYSIGQTEIIGFDLVKEELPPGSGNYSYRYKDFKKRIEGRTFDLILVDGPFGYGDPAYSRRDILDIVPICLEKDFSIIFDDYDRRGEKDTVEKLMAVLTDSGIGFHKQTLSGEKDICIIVSESNRFLTFF